MIKKLLPKKVRNYLYNCHDGYGFIAIKKDKDTITLVEIYQDKNGKYRTLGNNTELPDLTNFLI